MSELLKNVSVRVVGVSFTNDDGTSRQEILSGLSVGEAMLLKYFEYEGKPAYAVTTALGEQIGNLPQDLSSDIYERYRDNYMTAQIDSITGGDDGLKYGCVIDIDIYDEHPIESKSVESSSPAAPVKTGVSERTHNVSGIILIVLGIVLVLFGLLLLLVVPVGGVAAIIGGVAAVFIGRKYRKIVKERSENKI